MTKKRAKTAGFSISPGFDYLTPTYLPAQEEKQPPCQAGCPNCGDIRAWIGHVAQRDKTGISRQEAYTRAWETITDVNPFPATLGRICPHPCEDHCNRASLDEPLAINALERFLGDWAIEHRLPLSRIPSESADESVGVVGAGPSGLSFAYQMARRGYRVIVYESRSRAGGMLRYGVPDFRLPPDTLDAEISRIMKLGVEIKLNTVIGKDISLAELRKRHSNLYLGLGAQRGRGLGLPGEEGPSVLSGIEFLSRVNRGEEPRLGKAVVVVGGGNTAVDAARTARRSGAEVTILYRRSRREMPASREEIDDALEEGIELILQAAPVSIERSAEGKLTGLVACRMDLGEADSSGRRHPFQIPDSEFHIAIDSLITAVSQAPVLEGFESLERDGGGLSTDAHGMVSEGIQAGGDTLRLGIAGNAIVQGRYAAEALHARLLGKQEKPDTSDSRPSAGPESVNFDHKPGRSAVRPPKRPGTERITVEGEDTGTITEKQFLAEVERCFSCGACMGCEHCFMFCTSACYTKLEEVGPGMYFSLALDACKECGKCIEVCPSGFLDEARSRSVLPQSQDSGSE